VAAPGLTSYRPDRPKQSYCRKERKGGNGHTANGAPPFVDRLTQFDKREFKGTIVSEIVILFAGEGVVWSLDALLGLC
jgi:hypothetical protein